MKNKVVLLVAGLMGLTVASAVAAGLDKLAMAQDCLRMSGLEASLEGIPDMFEGMYRQQSLTASDPETLRQHFNLLNESYDVDAAKETVVRSLADNLDAKLLATLRSDLDQPWMARIIAEEAASYHADAQSEGLRYLADLQLTPPSRERVALLRRYVETTKAGDLGADLSLRLARGFAEPYLEDADDPEAAREAFDAAMEILREQVKAQVEQQALANSFYVYRNVSDQEMERYIEYSSTSDMQTFLETFRESLLDVLASTFMVANRKIADLSVDKACEEEPSSVPGEL